MHDAFSDHFLHLGCSSVKGILMLSWRVNSADTISGDTVCPASSGAATGYEDIYLDERAVRGPLFYTLSKHFLLASLECHHSAIKHAHGGFEVQTQTIGTRRTHPSRHSSSL